MLGACRNFWGVGRSGAQISLDSWAEVASGFDSVFHAFLACDSADKGYYGLVWFDPEVAEY